MAEEKNKITSYMELGFDVIYLTAVLAMGVFILATKSGQVSVMYGIMALVLGFGDSFHLIPRVASVVTGNEKKYEKAKGNGKLVTSITMTAFYLLLWQIGIVSFGLTNMSAYTAIIYFLAVLRIVLCMFPQNQWTSPKPPVSWGIYRNIPFALVGCAVIAMFLINASKVPSFQFTWLAVFLSFAFYIPVVILSNKYPKIGMLMIPKTIAYIWIVAMGLSV